LKAVADAVDAGADPAWLTKECLRWFRLALLALVNPDLIEGEVASDEARSIGERAAALGKSTVLTALRSLSESAAQRFSTQPRIDLELALARIILPSEELSLRALSDRLRSLEERTPAGKPSGNPPAASPAPSTSDGPPQSARKPAGKTAPARSAERATGQGDLSAARLTGLWPMILSAAKERSVQVYGHLQHAAVADASDELVTIGVDDRFNRDQLSDVKMTALVADAIAAATGSRPQVRFVLSPPSGAKAPPVSTGGLALAADVLGDDLF
jgi:hypothetical protein